jgi:hypothetical protein
LVSSSIGALIGKPMLFGPSVSGLWIVITNIYDCMLSFNVK